MFLECYFKTPTVSSVVFLSPFGNGPSPFARHSLRFYLFFFKNFVFACLFLFLANVMLLLDTRFARFSLKGVKLWKSPRLVEKNVKVLKSF